jgi:hypothetical protein
LLDTRLALGLKVKMLRGGGGAGFDSKDDDATLAVPLRLMAGLSSCSSYGQRALLVAKL